MLRLAADDATSERMWAKLPPVYWVAPVARAKPAAEVFLQDPSANRSTRYGKMPVVAAQQYGMGQVMCIGTDNTWRWRKNKGDEQYVTLWGQVIQRLALPQLARASTATQLTFDKKEYVTNEKVNLYARLYTESYTPITQEKVKGYITETGPDDPRAKEIILRPLPDQPGMYRAEFNAPEKAAAYKALRRVDHKTLSRSARKRTENGARRKRPQQRAPRKPRQSHRRQIRPRRRPRRPPRSDQSRRTQSQSQSRSRILDQPPLLRHPPAGRGVRMGPPEDGAIEIK